MNKRCSKSERPRSARLRRRPSLPIDEKKNKNKANEEHNGLGANQKNSHSKGLGIPGSFKRLGTSFFDRQPHGASNQVLNIPLGDVNHSDMKGNFVKISERELPKSPRILPKLNKSQRRPDQSDEDDGDEVTTSNGKSVKPFLDENRVSKGALQFGKHYSVLPNIAPINKDKA